MSENNMKIDMEKWIDVFPIKEILKARCSYVAQGISPNELTLVIPSFKLLGMKVIFAESEEVMVISGKLCEETKEREGD